MAITIQKIKKLVNLKCNHEKLSYAQIILVYELAEDSKKTRLYNKNRDKLEEDNLIEKNTSYTLFMKMKCLAEDTESEIEIFMLAVMLTPVIMAILNIEMNERME